MRVITGKAKGRQLRSVPGSGTRPITGRAKSALFSIVGGTIAGSSFLDLFAGTGQVGIEALSRGAAQVVLVEQAAVAVRTIRHNLAHTGLADGARVVRADVFRYLGGEPEPFDFIFVAPPQYRGLWAQTLQMLDERPQWLAPDGLVIVQIDPREFEELPTQTLALSDRRAYGGVELCFYGAVPRQRWARDSEPEA